jgi:hypothetical protein
LRTPQQVRGHPGPHGQVADEIRQLAAVGLTPAA